MSIPVITKNDVELLAIQVNGNKWNDATTWEQRIMNKEAFAILLNSAIFDEWEAAGHTFGFLGE